MEIAYQKFLLNKYDSLTKVNAAYQTDSRDQFAEHVHCRL